MARVRFNIDNNVTVTWTTGDGWESPEGSLLIRDKEALRWDKEEFNSIKLCASIIHFEVPQGTLLIWSTTFEKWYKARYGDIESRTKVDGTSWKDHWK
jgi:hypothetical protein